MRRGGKELRKRCETERTNSDERSVSGHEEVESREGNHVDRELSEIGVELSGESKGGGDTGHDSSD